MGATSSISAKFLDSEGSGDNFMTVIPSASSTSAKSVRNSKRDDWRDADSAPSLKGESDVHKVVRKSVNNFMDWAVKKSAAQQVNQEEYFMDSVYIKSWLGEHEASELFNQLSEIGRDIRPSDTAEAAKKRAKYPLWTKTYGYKRIKDGARALDRWGSYHESWVRVEEPPTPLKRCAERLRKRFNLTNDDVNSMVVNYYYDGSNTYIPAHRDTTACLADGSQVICLSLGASRDFVLCANEDAGKFDKSTMAIEREWRVGNGDLFALGQKTNIDFCHAITQDHHVQHMRISIIFRSVSRSFIDLDNAPNKAAVYSNGNRKFFAADCITTSGYHDAGTREHLADLITEREARKKATAEKIARASDFSKLTDYEKELRVSDANFMQQALNISAKGSKSIDSTSKPLSNVNKSDEANSTDSEVSDEEDERQRATHPSKNMALQSTVSSYYMGRGCAVPLQQ